jgi:hypothetical protein
MQRSLSTEQTKIVARRTTAYGTIKNFVFAGADTSGKNRVYRYKVETPEKIMLWRFSVNENGKIAEMILEEEE